LAPSVNTAREAATLTTVLMALPTVTECPPELAAPTEFRVSVGLVAPGMFAPLKRHW
jgi:hypothetical protein